MRTVPMTLAHDSSHFLTDYPGKCENLHGHRWRVVAYLETPGLQAEGTCKDMVVDFGEFKAALRGLTERLDHRFLIEEGSLGEDTLACLEREGFSLLAMPFRTTAENLVVLRPARRARPARCAGRRVRDAQQLRVLPQGRLVPWRFSPPKALTRRRRA